jgi:hypothetical protein
MIAIGLVEEAVRHTQSPAESIPFLLRKVDCEMSMGNPGAAFNTGIRFVSESYSFDFSAAHLLGPGLALPIGDAKAERFAESMHSRVMLSEEEILAVATLPPIEDATISFLQEILSKLSISQVSFSDCSSPVLPIPTAVSTCSLLPFLLSHCE